MDLKEVTYINGCKQILTLKVNPSLRIYCVMFSGEAEKHL